MKLCNNRQIVYADQAKMIYEEKKCVLAAGHRGAHSNGRGGVWLNGPDLMRIISEKPNQEPKIIVDMGAKKT